MTLTIQWADQHDFQTLLKRSEIEDKPVLLDLHSPQCRDCASHDRNIYSDPSIARDVMAYTLPVRVPTTDPDRASTDIINNHIYIWSPTIQLLAPGQTRYHEWNGAPRRTRLSVGYESVFHDTPGHLTPGSFKAQFLVARGKEALRKKKFRNAVRLFDEAIARHRKEVCGRTSDAVLGVPECRFAVVGLPGSPGQRLAHRFPCCAQARSYQGRVVGMHHERIVGANCKRL